MKRNKISEPSRRLLLSLISKRAPISRHKLALLSGLSRASVNTHLNALFKDNIIEEKQHLQSKNKGRPSMGIGLRSSFAYTLVTDIGETHIRVAISNLEPNILFEQVEPFSLLNGPQKTLDWIIIAFHELMISAKIEMKAILGIGISMPAPVGFTHKKVISPSVMIGWDNYDIEAHIQKQMSVPVYIENDVNLLTIKFARELANKDKNHMLLIKAGNGIGSGIITNGELYRGHDGVTGDIGHIFLESPKPAPTCRCEKLGCLEARAAGWALAKTLNAKGYPAQHARDVVKLVQQGLPEATILIRQAGKTVGKVASQMVSILNPGLIILTGTLTNTGDYFTTGVKEMIGITNLPIATQNLNIVCQPQTEQSGLLGAAYLVMQEVFSKN